MRQRLRDLHDILYRSYGPQHWWPAKTDFEMIVGAILTQNTAWANVEKAIAYLAEKGLLKPRSMRKVKRSRLAALVRPSGYYNIKAARLQCFTDFLFKRYGGSLKRMFKRDTESLREELLGVKGLGKETADSILLYAGKRPVFVVDAYTKRILSRHGIVPKDSDYDRVQELFTENLMPDSVFFGEFHALLVRLGKERCRKHPRCATCPMREFGKISV